jgi:hypothetical protein
LVVRDCAEWFAINWDNANAMLSGALGNKLFRPRAEAIDRCINNERQFVTPLTGKCANQDTECNGAIRGWLWFTKLGCRNGARGKERIKINAEEAGGDKPNKAKR